MIFVIQVYEDGDMWVCQMTEEDFGRAINASEEDFDLPSNIYPIDPEKLREDLRFEDRDPMYWSPKTILAIRGEIVKIKPVSRVTEWKVDG